MNAKMTKLNKNYVVLATLIAALGVIFSLFFAINSFAEEQIQDSNAVSHTVTGKIIDPNGDGVEGAQVNIYSPGTFFTGPTDSNGDFSIVISGETDPISITSWVAIKVGDDTRASLSFEGGEAASISSDQNLGTKTAFYTSGLVPEINGQIHDSDSYGSWNIPDSPATFNSGTPAVYYKTATAHTDGANLVVDYVDEVGVSKTWTWTFNPASGYEVQEVKIIKGNPWNSNATSYNLVESSFWQINAVTKPTTETIKISGTLYNPEGSAVEGARAGITFDSARQHYEAVSGNDGKFSIEVPASLIPIDTAQFDARRNPITGECAVMRSAGIELTNITGDKDLGNVTMYYESYLHYGINGSSQYSSEYGTWETQGAFSCLYSEGSVTVNGNVATINYTNASGESKNVVWTFTAAAPYYELSNITVEPRRAYTNDGSTDLKTSDYWFVNANVTKVVPKHVVTFDNTIQTVFANGHNLTSGEEVAEGSVLTITPVLPTDAKVTKIFVNDAVCTTGVYTLGTSDVSINAQSYDIATIKGTVTVDKVVNGQAKINLNKLLVDTAYAAEALEGATVTFTQNSDGWFTSDLTDAEGYFALNVVEHEAGVLTVSKEGYEPFTKEFSAEELVGEVEVTPVLTVAAQPENVNGSAQTGDNMPYGIALVVLAVSAFAVYRTARRPKGAHVK